MTMHDKQQMTLQRELCYGGGIAQFVRGFLLSETI